MMHGHVSSKAHAQAQSQEQQPQMQVQAQAQAHGQTQGQQQAQTQGQPQQQQVQAQGQQPQQQQPITAAHVHQLRALQASILRSMPPLLVTPPSPAAQAERLDSLSKLCDGHSACKHPPSPGDLARQVVNAQRGEDGSDW